MVKTRGGEMRLQKIAIAYILSAVFCSTPTCSMTYEAAKKILVVKAAEHDPSSSPTQVQETFAKYLSWVHFAYAQAEPKFKFKSKWVLELWSAYEENLLPPECKPSMQKANAFRLQLVKLVGSTTLNKVEAQLEKPATSWTRNEVGVPIERRLPK
jgi:Tfp pilus assembly protein PilP